MQFIQSTGETTVIELSGKLDYATAGVLMEELKTLIGQDIKRVDIQCAELEYISSAGVRAILFLKQKIDKNVEVEVCMHKASAAVKDIFKLIGLDGYFEFVD